MKDTKNIYIIKCVCNIFYILSILLSDILIYYILRNDNSIECNVYASILHIYLFFLLYIMIDCLVLEFTSSTVFQRKIAPKLERCAAYHDIITLRIQIFFLCHFNNIMAIFAIVYPFTISMLIQHQLHLEYYNIPAFNNQTILYAKSVANTRNLEQLCDVLMDLDKLYFVILSHDRLSNNSENFFLHSIDYEQKRSFLIWLVMDAERQHATYKDTMYKLQGNNSKAQTWDPFELFFRCVKKYTEFRIEESRRMHHRLENDMLFPMKTEPNPMKLPYNQTHYDTDKRLEALPGYRQYKEEVLSEMHKKHMRILDKKLFPCFRLAILPVNLDALNADNGIIGAFRLFSEFHSRSLFLSYEAGLQMDKQLFRDLLFIEDEQIRIQNKKLIESSIESDANEKFDPNSEVLLLDNDENLGPPAIPETGRNPLLTSTNKVVFYDEENLGIATVPDVTDRLERKPGSNIEFIDKSTNGSYIPARAVDPVEPRIYIDPPRPESDEICTRIERYQRVYGKFPLKFNINGNWLTAREILTNRKNELSHSMANMRDYLEANGFSQGPISLYTGHRVETNIYALHVKKEYLRLLLADPMVGDMWETWFKLFYLFRTHYIGLSIDKDLEVDPRTTYMEHLRIFGEDYVVFPDRENPRIELSGPAPIVTDIIDYDSDSDTENAVLEDFVPIIEPDVTYYDSDTEQSYTVPCMTGSLRRNPVTNNFEIYDERSEDWITYELIRKDEATGELESYDVSHGAWYPRDAAILISMYKQSDTANITENTNAQTTTKTPFNTIMAANPFSRTQTMGVLNTPIDTDVLETTTTNETTADETVETANTSRVPPIVITALNKTNVHEHTDTILKRSQSDPEILDVD